MRGLMSTSDRTETSPDKEESVPNQAQRERGHSSVCERACRRMEYVARTSGRAGQRGWLVAVGRCGPRYRGGARLAREGCEGECGGERQRRPEESWDQQGAAAKHDGVPPGGEPHGAPDQVGADDRRGAAVHLREPVGVQGVGEDPISGCLLVDGEGHGVAGVVESDEAGTRGGWVELRDGLNQRKIGGE